MHEGRNLRGMRAVQPGEPDGSRASLKFGVQSMFTDSCYFFSLPRVSTGTVGDFLDPNIRVIRGPYCTEVSYERKTGVSHKAEVS